jgi:hypothetical protein
MIQILCASFSPDLPELSKCCQTSTLRSHTKFLDVIRSKRAASHVLNTIRASSSMGYIRSSLLWTFTKGWRNLDGELVPYDLRDPGTCTFSS